LKQEIRQRITQAALEAFAAHGYEGASMAAIAERAGLGTTTAYRYFAGKAELFDAVVSPELAARFEVLLDRRVKALAHVAFGQSNDDTGEEMLRFWIEHRLAVVVLLDRAQGTAYEAFGERFVQQLVTTSIAQMRKHRPSVRVSAPARFVLQRIFEGTRRTLAAILEQHASERELRDAIEGFWSYQVPGLRGFAAWVAHDAKNGRLRSRSLED
jgi:AcrR family transcriptional regulator